MAKTAAGTDWANISSPGNAFNERISADGDAPDRNDIDALGKGLHDHFHTTGTGKIAPLTSDTDAATVTFNMATSNKHTVTLGGNRTLAVSNVTTGQVFSITLVQDGTGSRTVTWWSTIRWPGAAAPTLTTTASRSDTFVFLCTGSGTYDGFTAGQNLG